MINFDSNRLFKLKAEELKAGEGKIFQLLVEGEHVIASFVSGRDSVIFTTKRLVSVNVQGLTGTKIDYTSIPYNKIQAYSMETAGFGDNDAEIELWITSIGKLRFELKASTDIRALCGAISTYVL